MPEIIVEKQYGPAKRAIWQGLKRYNESKIGRLKEKTIAVTIRDGETILGGATAQVWGTWMFVELLWLDETLRHQKLGSKVMDQIEAEGRRHGARFAYVDTFSFQARPFYESRGYHIFGTLEEFPEGHARYWLRKDL
jgi:GNAT superfamily N-acetyltransferase